MIDKTDLMHLYWSKQMTAESIGQIYGYTKNQVQHMIQKYDLGKKKHGIRHRGRKGYLMPKDERIKHQNQPHSRSISQICPITGKIVDTYRSITAAEENGFRRENIRKALKTAGLHKGFLWSLEGLEGGIFRIAKKRGVDKKLKKLSVVKPKKTELYLFYIKRDETLQELAKRYEARVETVARWLSSYNIFKRKNLPKLTPKILKQEYQRGMKTSEIAEKYQRKEETIKTYKSRWRIKI